MNNSLDKSWKLAEVKRENESLYREVHGLRAELRQLHIEIENARGSQAGTVYRGDASCSRCDAYLGSIHGPAALYKYCPFCGVRIDGWEED